MSAASSQPRRRWFQFTLRGLLLLVVLVALGAYAYRSCVEPYRRQREALKVLGDLGAMMRTAPATDWEQRLFGRNLVHITEVHLADSDEPEKYLPHVAGLPHLELLVVGGLSFRDEHLRRLHGIASLKSLVLDSADVSPTALAACEQALPGCGVYRSQRRAAAALRDRPGAVFSTIRYEGALLPADVAWRIDNEHLWQAVEADVDLYWNDSEADLLAHLSWLKCLYTLKKLSLKGRIKDDHLLYLSGLPLLNSLYLANSDVTDAGLVEVAKLTELWELDISTTRVGSAGVRHLQALEHLRELHLRGTYTDDTGLEALRSLTRLRELFLGGSNITDAGLVHLTALEQLEWLDLGHTSVTDAGMAHLANLTHLKHLDVGATKVGDAGLSHWQNLAALEYVSLDNTQVSDAGLEKLRRLPRLEEIWLVGTRVSDEGVRQLRAARANCRVVANPRPPPASLPQPPAVSQR
jgi:hypothetical protein